MSSPPARIDRLETLSDHYSVILCDVWGVVHNGVDAFTNGCAALARAREAGKAIILITNSPRPNMGVEQQFDLIGVPRNSWDQIVTSGDVTRELISNSARRIFHLGPERDYPLYDGLDVEFVEEFEAAAVCCTGLFNDEVEIPEDYTDLLRRLRSRDLPMICANPDIVVERGDRMIWCAGSLAREYGLMGGRTMIAGKPHKPIYDEALAAAANVLGREFTASEVLAIGDGMLTDIKGATDAGIDALYISAGIHAAEYGEAGDPDIKRLAAFLRTHVQEPVGFMPRLR